MDSNDFNDERPGCAIGIVLLLGPLFLLSLVIYVLIKLFS